LMRCDPRCVTEPCRRSAVGRSYLAARFIVFSL
jgi:hypothetical protein